MQYAQQTGETHKISVRKPKRMNNFRDTGTDDMVLKLNLEKSTDTNST